MSQTRNFIVICLIAMVLLGGISVAAASKSNEKIQIISPSGGAKIGYGGEITVKFIDAYPNVIEYVSIVGESGQVGTRMTVIKKSNASVQTVVFDTSNNVLPPGKYRVNVRVSRNGKVLATKTGEIFEVTNGFLVVGPVIVSPVWSNGETIRRFDLENPTDHSVTVNAIWLLCKGNCAGLIGTSLGMGVWNKDPYFNDIYTQAAYLSYPVMQPGERRTITLRWSANEQDANAVAITLINLQEQVGNTKYQQIENMLLQASN